MRLLVLGSSDTTAPLILPQLLLELGIKAAPAEAYFAIEETLAHSPCVSRSLHRTALRQSTNATLARRDFERILLLFAIIMEPLGSLVAVISIFGGLAAVSLVARLYTRFLLVRQPGWDDALVVVGMVSGVALNVVAVFCKSSS